jgi:hypothetical protein
MNCHAWAPDTYCTTGPLTHHQPNHWTHWWLCPHHFAEVKQR